MWMSLEHRKYWSISWQIWTMRFRGMQIMELGEMTEKRKESMLRYFIRKTNLNCWIRELFGCPKLLINRVKAGMQPCREFAVGFNWKKKNPDRLCGFSTCIW